MALLASSRQVTKTTHLGWGYNGVGTHDSVGVLLSNFWNHESPHPWAGASTQWMGQLEALQHKNENQNKLATEQSPLHSVYLEQLCLKTQRKQ